MLHGRFERESWTLNSFFSTQCSLVSDNSCSIPSYINYATENFIYSRTFSQRYRQIIQNRDSNKAHTHDDIIIRIPGVFPSELKKTNIVPVQKKIDKQNIKNYRPAVYLLPICDKIFEKIIFNEMFRFLSLIILFHQ